MDFEFSGRGGAWRRSCCGSDVVAWSDNARGRPGYGAVGAFVFWGSLICLFWGVATLCRVVVQWVKRYM